MQNQQLGLVSHQYPGNSANMDSICQAKERSSTLEQTIIFFLFSLDTIIIRFMPPHFIPLFSNLQPVWGGIDRNVPCKATADPAGLRSLRLSRPRPSGAVQRPGTCTADASWHSSALCTVLALRERPNTRPFLVPSLASYQLILTTY